MPTVLLGDQLPESAFGRIGSHSLGRTGLFRLTLYITAVCSWSLFLLARRHVRRLSSHALRNLTRSYSTAAAATAATDTAEEEEQRPLPSEKSLLQWRYISRDGLVNTVLLVFQVVWGSYNEFVLAAIVMHAQKQITWRERKLLCAPKDFISIIFPDNIQDMHFEKFDYVALDLPWISDRPQLEETEAQLPVLVLAGKDPLPCEHRSIKAYIGSPATYTTSDIPSESIKENHSILPLSTMGAVESLPAQGDHHLLYDSAKTDDTAESPNHSASENLQHSAKGASFSSAAVCLSYCSKEAGGAIIESEKTQNLRRSSARSLLRASLRRYDQMAPMWARSGSKCNAVDSAVVDETQNSASVDNITPVSPKRMASADDIGALARAVERRRLDSGEAEYYRPAEQHQNQQSQAISASMPHLPSRITFLRDSFESSEKDIDDATQGPPGSIAAVALGGISEGTSAAASLLMFPIDFISPSSSPSLQGVSDKDNGTRKMRSSSISEIRQRLARRLSRNNYKQNRRKSRNSSPSTSPTVMSKSIGVAAIERGSAALIGAPKNIIQSADELAAEFTKLSMDDSASDSKDKTEESTRLLSESIDCLLEKRLCPEISLDSADASDQIQNSVHEPLPTSSSTSKSSIASAASSLTLSDSDSTSEITGDEGTEILDYDEYMYLNTCKDSTSSSRNTDNSGSNVSALGAVDTDMVVSDENRAPSNCSSMVRRWWPRRVLPVHNMQYMPKLSKIFAEAAQKSRDVGEYLCPDCSTAAINASSSSGRLSPPVDEVMMSGSMQMPVECSDIECRNYMHTDSGCGSSSVTLKDWFSSTPSSAHSSSELSFGYLKPVNTKRGDNRLSGYWDILSRCPMRPTSGLALSSLKAMARASLSSDSTRSSRHAYSRKINDVGAPISRRARRLADSSESDTDEDTDYSDDDNASDNDEPLLTGFLSSSSSAQVRQRGHIAASGNSSSGSGNSTRGKQRQKRMLSEPMQYILYNSYLRYYGRPGEN